MSNIFRSFIKLNRSLYNKLIYFFPQTNFSIDKYYYQQVKSNIADEITILDVGGGKSCRFAGEKKKLHGVKIIALDVSEDELKYNHDVDEKIVSDIASGEPILGINDTSIDLVTSSSVLEHLKNLDAAINEISRIIKPGGKFISMLPNKFALFAIINQMLPHWLARKILFSISPEAKGICGFRAYYNRCYYGALKRLLAKHGFEMSDFKCSFNQSGYFSFFIPFALISLLWDFLMYKLNIKTCCAYMCFTATKKY